MSEQIEKEVKDFLRTADVLIARMQTAKPLSHRAMIYLESYLARVKAVMLSLKSYESIQKSRELADRNLPDK